MDSAEASTKTLNLRFQEAGVDVFIPIPSTKYNKNP